MKHLKKYDEQIFILNENKLNEDKMTEYLSKNFQKLTSEIQKLDKKINLIVNEINNITKLNNLKR